MTSITWWYFASRGNFSKAMIKMSHYAKLLSRAFFPLPLCLSMFALLCMFHQKVIHDKRWEISFRFILSLHTYLHTHREHTQRLHKEWKNLHISTWRRGVDDKCGKWYRMKRNHHKNKKKMYFVKECLTSAIVSFFFYHLLIVPTSSNHQTYVLHHNIASCKKKSSAEREWEWEWGKRDLLNSTIEISEN